MITSTFAASIWLLACSSTPSSNDTEKQSANSGGSSNGSNSTGGSSSSAGTTSSGGSSPTGRAGGGSGGSGGTASDPSDGRGGAATAGSGATDDPPTEKFSFFMTSLEAMRELSGSQDGFGGDLRFGEATGLAGADKICATIAEKSMPGASKKQWRAFLSASKGGPQGGPVNAIDRIGNGPWYDRLGRLFANDRAALLNERPRGAEPLIINDFPNERGEPNHQGVDNHDVVTGSAKDGTYDAESGGTCEDWTSTADDIGMPRVGHSWPRGADNGRHWISDHNAPGCGAGVELSMNSPGDRQCIGCGGGYGALYCFALTP